VTPEEIAIRADALMSEAQKTYRDAARLEWLNRRWGGTQRWVALIEARERIEAVERERDEARAIVRLMLAAHSSPSELFTSFPVAIANASKAVRRWESET
jgi:hypothetical protein